MAFTDWWNSALERTRQNGEDAREQRWNNPYQFEDGTLLSRYQNASTGADKWNTGLTIGTAAINGLTGIATVGMNAARIQDTPEFDARMADFNTIANADYGNYSQIMGGYQNLGTAPVQRYADVRGMTDGQKALSVGSGILQGASTGKAIGGWPGALIGGFVGGIGSVFGISRGDTKAYLKTQEDNLNAQIAQNNGYKNLLSETEGVRDYNFRNSIAHRRANGGPINKQMDIRDFANRVLNRNDKPVRIVRTKCKGGVMIKINR